MSLGHCLISTASVPATQIGGAHRTHLAECVKRGGVYPERSEGLGLLRQYPRSFALKGALS